MNIDTIMNPGPASRDQHPTDENQAEQALTMQNLDDYLTDDKYGYQELRSGDIRDGVVVTINDQGVIMDVGFKREGLVPAEDLEHLDEETRAGIQAGATIPVYILRPEDRDGRPILSIHQARMHQDWLEAEKMMERGDLFEGEISGYNRGGLIVKFGKIRGFIPSSQIVGMPRRMREEQRRQRMTSMIGQQVGLKVIEVDRHRRRLIFSQRRARRAWQELQRERVMGELTEGEVRHGKITSITDFGAFVDLGGADGLIHVSELSWGRVNHPREVLKVGDEVDVYVLNVDRERKRIALSLKKLQPDPWTLVEDHYVEGQLVEGQVTRVLEFGAFIELDLGIDGLLHASEMIGTPELKPVDIVHPGEKLLVKITRIDGTRKRIALSTRQVRQEEWERWMAEQQVEAEAETEVEASADIEPIASEEMVEAEAEIEVEAPTTAEPVATEEPVEAEAETEVEASAAVEPIASEAMVEATAPVEASAEVEDSTLEEEAAEEIQAPTAEEAIDDVTDEAAEPVVEPAEELAEGLAEGSAEGSVEEETAEPD